MYSHVQEKNDYHFCVAVMMYQIHPIMFTRLLFFTNLCKPEKHETDEKHESSPAPNAREMLSRLRTTIEVLQKDVGDAKERSSLSNDPEKFQPGDLAVTRELGGEYVAVMGVHGEEIQIQYKRFPGNPLSDFDGDIETCASSDIMRVESRREMATWYFMESRLENLLKEFKEDEERTAKADKLVEHNWMMAGSKNRD